MDQPNTSKIRLEKKMFHTRVIRFYQMLQIQIGYTYLTLNVDMKELSNNFKIFNGNLHFLFNTFITDSYRDLFKILQ